MVGMIAYRRKSAPEELPPGPQQPPAPKPSAVERMKAKQQGIQAAPYRQPVQPPRIESKSPFAPKEPDKPPIQGPAAETPAPPSKTELAKIRGAAPPEEEPARPEPTSPVQTQKEPEIDLSDLSKLSTEQILDLYRKRQAELAKQNPEPTEGEQGYFSQKMTGGLPTPPKEWHVYRKVGSGEKEQHIPLDLETGGEPHFDFRERVKLIPVFDKDGAPKIDPKTGEVQQYRKVTIDPHVYLATQAGSVIHIHKVDKKIPVLDDNGNPTYEKKKKAFSKVVTDPEGNPVIVETKSGRKVKKKITTIKEVDVPVENKREFFDIEAWAAPITSKRQLRPTKPDWKTVRRLATTVRPAEEAEDLRTQAQGNSHTYEDTVAYLGDLLGSKAAATNVLTRLQVGG